MQLREYAEMVGRNVAFGFVPFSESLGSLSGGTFGRNPSPSWYYFETDEFTLVRFTVNGDLVHSGAGWTLAAEANDLLDAAFFAFENCFDASIAEVSHPPRNAQRLSNPLGFISEKDALHPARYEKMNPHVQNGINSP